MGLGNGLGKSESEEHIIEMRGFGPGAIMGTKGSKGSMDYAKMPDGSETVTWAQSDRSSRDENREMRGLGITKTMEVTVDKEDK